MKTTILSLLISLAGNTSTEVKANEVLQAPVARVQPTAPNIKGIKIMSKQEIDRLAVEKVTSLDAEMAGFPKHNALLENQLKSMKLAERFVEVQFLLVRDHLETSYSLGE
jgi:signal-transduction protein with cAMP-binding, CBS, and nucleotidyltransferase domain